MGTEIAIAGLLLSAASTAVSVSSATEAKKDAGKKREAQEKQQALTDRLNKAKARRTARIQRSKLAVASAASGAPGSTILGSEISLGTTLTEQTDILTSQSAIQSEQFDIQKSQTIDAANLNIAQSVASFAGTAIDTVEDNPKLFGV